MNVDEQKKKDIKKKKIRDDTEQPLYPCEECTQCFTTLSDLKVCLLLYLFSCLLIKSNVDATLVEQHEYFAFVITLIKTVNVIIKHFHRYIPELITK